MISVLLVLFQQVMVFKITVMYMWTTSLLKNIVGPFGVSIILLINNISAENAAIFTLIGVWKHTMFVSLSGIIFLFPIQYLEAILRYC